MEDQCDVALHANLSPNVAQTPQRNGTEMVKEKGGR